jgi:hypothetical protein
MNWEEAEYASEEEKTALINGLRDARFKFGMPNISYLLLRSKSDGSRTLSIKIDHGSYDGTLLRIFDTQFLAISRGDKILPQVEPFKHYIDWLHEEDRATDLNFWKSELDSYEPATGLPLKPVSDRLKFAAIEADIDAITEVFSVTPQTIFQAAYAVVAGQLTETSDVLVNNLITGRNAGVENPQLLNGTCANFLPFRTRLHSSTKTSAFLTDTQTAFWDSTEHGTVGITEIYNALSRDRDVHSAKLLFCFQPFEPAPAGAAVNHMRWVVMAQSKVLMTINYALMVEVQKTAKGYRLKLQWDGRAFSEERIDAAVQMFEGIFRTMEKGQDVELGFLL